MKNIFKKLFKKKYSPQIFWNNWANDFIKDEWQVKIHAQHLWLLRMVKKEKPKNILEVGCGFGRNIKFLIDNDISAESLNGIDISDEMIKLAKKYIKNKKVKLKVSDITNFSLKNKFDFVFTHGVLMHVPVENIEIVLDKIIAISKKDILFIEQNYKADNNYTFIHEYKHLLKKKKLDIIEYRKNKKIGLDLIHVKVR